MQANRIQDSLEKHSQLVHELRLALAQNQFKLYFQKRVNLAGQTNGAEVLLRWANPQRGFILPQDFIPQAEETGIIVPIGLWVLEETCRYLRAWKTQDKLKHLKLSVNISTAELKQPDFVNHVNDIVLNADIDPSRLIFEITERMLQENMDDFVAKMEQIRALGITFSLDCFGTGFSSLYYLKKLPIYELKIDKRFTQTVTSDRCNEAIVQTIIQMGNTLGLDVVAEGVETPEQFDILQMYGCPYYQGFLFGRPTIIENYVKEFT